MNPIVFPLQLRIQGAHVGDLQDALQQSLDRGALLANDDGARRELQTGLLRERGEQTYGDVTAKLVSIFQTERQLQATGEVDERTANVLNSLLREWGLLLDHATGGTKLVTGAARREDGFPIPGLLVHAAHRADQVPIRLGEDTTDAEGRYTIRYEPLGVQAINLAVSALADDGRTLATSQAAGDAKPLEIVDLIVPEIEVEPNLVDGKVASRSSASVGNLRVVIIDRGVGGDADLTDVTTDSAGAYQAKFSNAEVRKRGKSRPDLQARVYAGETLLGASEVRYNAPRQVTLNVMLSEQSTSSLSSEHEALTRSLAAHYQGKLADLKETDERQDVSYLANKSGWDARAVALAALADQFSARTADATGTPAIAQPYFYALFRAGLAANEETLYRTDAKTIQSAWKVAAEQGVIPTASAEELSRLAGRFQEVTAQRLLDSPALIGASSLKEMLVSSRLTAEQQTSFARHYAANRSDTTALWNAVEGDSAFGAQIEDRRAMVKRLQLDGKLGFLTLNNAPLITSVHAAIGDGGLSDPVQLAQAGFHHADAWSGVLAGVPVPKEIPGESEEKRANYGRYLAAQVRLSYPTASLAEMVKSGSLTLTGAAEGVSSSVHQFLTEQQATFEIGVQPVQQYIARNNLHVADETVHQVKRLQRVYHMTPSDTALAGLMKRGVDSASDVVRYDKSTFVQNFAEDLGGADPAALTYDRATQIHNTVLNVALSYLSAKTTPAVGVHSPPNVIDPTPDNAGDVIAYATLESLFGSMDFCACDHCRSILSPAAYLVDLLQFIGSDEMAWSAFAASWKSPIGGHGGAPYPFETAAAFTQAGSPAGTEISPFEVLMSRRPDIQHLPLSCENTNTAIPYIDIVNETLEYFIANSTQPLSLQNYRGHDTNSVASEDLLASPQFVMDSAYATLAGERFPDPLPFHRPLESLRGYFAKFKVPLPVSMEHLRKSDDVERGGNPYGWRDILMEEIGLSRADYEVLTDSVAVPLWRLYGFPNGTADVAVIAALARAPQFALRMGISYEDLISILETQFVNPNSLLVPKLERLGVSFAVIKALKDGSITDADFDSRLASLTVPPDPAAYGGDIKAWVRNDANFLRIMSIITLAVPATPWTSATPFAVGDCVRPTVAAAASTHYFECTVTGSSGAIEPAWPAAVGSKISDGTVEWTERDASSCASFSNLAFRFSDPTKSNQDLSAAAFFRLRRFIRLWKKLGWTIAQTDAAICGLFQSNLAQFGADVADDISELDAGFAILIPRIGIVKRVMNALGLTLKRDLLSLLACWSEIGTHGAGSLYSQMFLNRALLTQDDVFADKGSGEFLVDRPAKKLAVHVEAIRSAFNLTGDEYDRIVEVLGYDSGTDLTIAGISAIYRRGWLARALKISVREFLLLTQLTGLDPFGLPNVARPSILRLIAFVQAMRDRSFKSSSALYLVWNQDLSNKSAPTEAEQATLARTLRSAYSALEAEFGVADDPDGSIAQSRMGTVYGSSAASFFFGLLNDTFSVEVEFADPERVFAPGPTRVAIESAAGKTDSGAPRVAYDDFRKRLSCLGALTPTTRDTIKTAAGVGAAAFKMAMDNLQSRNQDAVDPFFARYPELRAAYVAYAANASATAIEKRTTLLRTITPELIARRKRQQALQTMSAAVNSDLPLAEAFLDPATTPYPFHATGDSSQPALTDVLALQTRGLSVQFFAGDVAAGPIIPTPDIASSVDYAPATSIVLPANPTPGSAISGIWKGSIEVPETGFFNLRIDADAGASVSLTIDAAPVALIQNATLWTNSVALALRAGSLYAITLTIEKVRQRARLQWEWMPKGQGRVTVPSLYLYPKATLDAFRQTYVRFLKAASLAGDLGLTANELTHFATHADYYISAKPWMNALAAEGNPSAPDAAALLYPLEDLLGFVRIKADLATGDESLLTILKDPAGSASKRDSLLFAMTRWNPASLDLVLAHFGSTLAMLSGFGLFSRVYAAMGMSQVLGVSPAALIQVTTNEPAGDTVRNLQAALCARYDAATWRDLVRPINDMLREMQRDALVGYILHQMGAHAATRHIDTPDKLFEYFLMDVQMASCMETSRIRHALSCVQLFVERCLMNLEPRVSSTALNAKQWDWRKRYRVWEANRKIYLYPENWLEPELRDDKSPLFKQLENELKQGDITEARAAVAFGKYLSQLDEVAKLEPCGIHHIPRDDIKTTGEVNHVIARSTGAGGKYYYRRQEYGYWTPWEAIKLGIDDKPVAPVVWKGRLLLFWLRLIKEVPLTGPNTTITTEASEKPISGISLSDIKQNAKITADQAPPVIRVKAILCWSEYQDGTWQEPKTSDVDHPADMGLYPGVGFDRSRFWLAFGQADDVLRVEVQDGFTLGGRTWFHLYNTYSSPVSRDVDPATPSLPFFAFRSHTYPPLRLNYWNPFVSQMLPRDLLGGSGPGPRVMAPHHILPNSWTPPFFYEDARHAFYVTSSFQPVWISDYSDFGFLGSLSTDQVVNIPPIIMQIDPGLKVEKKPWPGPGPLVTDMQAIDTVPIERFVTEDAHIRQAFATTGVVKFGDKQIGPAGVVSSTAKITGAS